MPLNKSWHNYNESLIERGRLLITDYRVTLLLTVIIITHGTFNMFVFFVNRSYSLAFAPNKESLLC